MRQKEKVEDRRKDAREKSKASKQRKVSSSASSTPSSTSSSSNLISNSQAKVTKPNPTPVQPTAPTPTPSQPRVEEYHAPVFYTGVTWKEKYQFQEEIKNLMYLYGDCKYVADDSSELMEMIVKEFLGRIIEKVLETQKISQSEIPSSNFVYNITMKDILLLISKKKQKILRIQDHLTFLLLKRKQNKQKKIELSEEGSNNENPKKYRKISEVEREEINNIKIETEENPVELSHSIQFPIVNFFDTLQLFPFFSNSQFYFTLLDDIDPIDLSKLTILRNSVSIHFVILLKRFFNHTIISLKKNSLLL